MKKKSSEVERTENINSNSSNFDKAKNISRFIGFSSFLVLVAGLFYSFGLMWYWNYIEYFGFDTSMFGLPVHEIMLLGGARLFIAFKVNTLVVLASFLWITHFLSTIGKETDALLDILSRKISKRIKSKISCKKKNKKWSDSQRELYSAIESLYDKFSESILMWMSVLMCVLVAYLLVGELLISAGQDGQDSAKDLTFRYINFDIKDAEASKYFERYGNIYLKDHSLQGAEKFRAAIIQCNDYGCGVLEKEKTTFYYHRDIRKIEYLKSEVFDQKHFDKLKAKYKKDTESDLGNDTKVKELKLTEVE